MLTNIDTSPTFITRCLFGLRRPSTRIRPTSRPGLRSSVACRWGLILLCGSWVGSAHAYPMTFPARHDSLSNGVYFECDGHTNPDYGNGMWGMDMTAMAFDGTNWQQYSNGDKATATNEEAYVWGAEVYAPEDGEIFGCWRTAPDKPDPASNYDFDDDGVDDSSPMAAGNHLQIRNSAGDHLIYFAHLQEGSIPPELCPLPASADDVDLTSNPPAVLPGPDGWPDNLDESTCGIPGWGGFPQDTLLQNPIPIKEGDFLGRIGHSGQSSGPHLHLHVKPYDEDTQGRPCEDVSVEIEFYEAWSQTCDYQQDVITTGWGKLNGQNPVEPWDIGGNCEDDSDCVGAEECSSQGQCVVTKSRYCFLPDAIGAQEDHIDIDVPATNMHFTTHADGDVLVYQDAGNLRLRSYDLWGSGVIDEQDVQNEGGVLDVAVARPNANRHVVVSIRGNNGKLKHIPYWVSTASGNITRQYGKEWTDGTVYRVDSTPSPAHDGFVVAVEDSLGNLKVIDYHVDGALNIDRDYSGTGTGGAIDDVAITSLTNFDGVVTAEITSSGWLYMRSFDVPAAGGVTAADTHFTIVAGSSVTIDPVRTLFGIYEYVVTTVIQPDQTLRVDTWHVDSSGNLTWVDFDTTGIVSEHDGTSGSTILGDFVATVRDSTGGFRVIGWGLDWDGTIGRSATRDLGSISQTAVVASSAGGSDHLVAARTDVAGDLHLFSYGENFSSVY